jgi:transcriptional regulator GlxA family with amidase domain
VLGKSPISHVLDLRVERAVHLLKTTAAASTRSRSRWATPTA